MCQTARSEGQVIPVVIGLEDTQHGVQHRRRHHSKRDSMVGDRREGGGCVELGQQQAAGSRLVKPGGQRLRYRAELPARPA
jgi:hypothetical protein